MLSRLFSHLTLVVETDRSIHGFLQMISNQYLPSYAIIFQLIQDHVYIFSLCKIPPAAGEESLVVALLVSVVGKDGIVFSFI